MRARRNTTVRYRSLGDWQAAMDAARQAAGGRPARASRVIAAMSVASNDGRRRSDIDTGRPARAALTGDAAAHKPSDSEIVGDPGFTALLAAEGAGPSVAACRCSPASAGRE